LKAGIRGCDFIPFARPRSAPSLQVEGRRASEPLAADPGRRLRHIFEITDTERQEPVPHPIIAAARLSLEESEKLEARGDRSSAVIKPNVYERSRDELLLSVAQSNLAIAEALAGGDDWAPEGEWTDHEEFLRDALHHIRRLCRGHGPAKTWDIPGAINEIVGFALDGKFIDSEHVDAFVKERLG
jgi:hypothetical protein